jgi:hypothetical protein
MRKSSYVTAAGGELNINISNPDKNKYIDVELVTNNYDSLLDAMKAQAARNLEIANEIIAKADAFDKEYQPKKVTSKRKK